MIKWGVMLGSEIRGVGKAMMIIQPYLKRYFKTLRKAKMEFFGQLLNY